MLRAHSGPGSIGKHHRGYEGEKKKEGPETQPQREERAVKKCFPNLNFPQPWELQVQMRPLNGNDLVLRSLCPLADVGTAGSVPIMLIVFSKKALVSFYL